MATQGVVTIKHDDKVVMKFVAGCDGMKAPLLARRLRESGEVPSLEAAYDLATKVGFGSESCLVVMDETREVFRGDEDLGPLYRQTFDQAEFNPRWEYGTADYIIVVDL